MSSQSDFINGMQGFRLAQAHDDLIEKAPDETLHNLRAKTLRNGIAIIGFSVLEHFIRERTGELLLAFDQVGTPFDDLPERIKTTATKGAIKGISSRLKFSDAEITFTQSESRIIASSLDSTYKISKYSIGWENSNLDVDTVRSIFKLFNIENGWAQIDRLSNKLNMTILSSKDSFKNAVDRRHDAAHNYNAIIQPTDLSSFLRDAYMIAIGFDALISAAFSKIYLGDNDYLNNNKKIVSGDIKFRTVVFKNNKWKEYSEGSDRATKQSNNKGLLWPIALAHAKKNNEILVCMDKEGLPCEWEFPSLP